MHRYLDPASTMGEILFGLVMTLTFTLSAGIIIEDEGREGARQLLIAALGCNIAWGIIDAAFYLGGQLFERGRLRRIGRMIRQSPTRRRAEALVAEELDGMLAGVTSEADRSALYQRIVDNVHAQPPRPNTLTKADFYGALVSGLLVIVTCVPAAIPFLLFDDARFALRVSNGILLAMLFITGYLWARHTLSKPWLVGVCFLIAGTLLVAVAIPLGG